jgi:hypothetical protein
MNKRRAVHNTAVVIAFLLLAVGAVGLAVYIGTNGPITERILLSGTALVMAMFVALVWAAR